MKIDHITRQFERAKAINRKYGTPVVRYSLDMDQIVPWDWEQETDVDEILELEDDYSEESFP